MKNLKSLPAIFAFALSMFLFNGANAQTGARSCDNYTKVASSCVGVCGNPSEINYTYTLCEGFVGNFCVINDASSLCSTHVAAAWIYVDGVLEATGNITQVGSTISFKAECGSEIRVVVRAKPKDDTVTQCVWLGKLDYSLRQK